MTEERTDGTCLLCSKYIELTDGRWVAPLDDHEHIPAPKHVLELAAELQALREQED